MRVTPSSAIDDTARRGTARGSSACSASIAWRCTPRGSAYASTGSTICMRRRCLLHGARCSNRSVGKAGSMGAVGCNAVRGVNKARPVGRLSHTLASRDVTRTSLQRVTASTHRLQEVEFTVQLSEDSLQPVLATALSVDCTAVRIVRCTVQLYDLSTPHSHHGEQ